jgi:hypothetical protein
MFSDHGLGFALIYEFVFGAGKVLVLQKTIPSHNPLIS